MLELRKAERKDYKEICNLYETLDYSSQIIGETKVPDPYTLKSRGSIDIECELSEQDYEKMLQEEKLFSFFENNKFVGYTEIIVKDNKWHIEEFGIKIEKQHRGFGNKFFNMLQAEAHKRNVRKLTLTCFSKGSIEFWKKQGFKARKKFRFGWKKTVAK